MSEISFADRVVIVTGAGNGLGREYALELGRRGAKVVVNDLGVAVDGSGRSSEAADAVVADIEAAGGEAIASMASVTDDKAVEEMVGQAMSKWGRIDGLISNAGILRDKSFAKMEIDDFAVVLDVHFMGTVKPIRAVWEIMRAQNYGRIVVTTSSSGLYGNFGQANYSAAKMALVGLMNTLELEGVKYNIRTNAIAPGAKTRMTTGPVSDPDKLMRADQVAPGVMWLASEDAPNGVVLCAASGVFTMAAVHETAPVYLGVKPTAEQVRDAWGQITDVSDLSHIHDAKSQGMKYNGFVQEHA